MPIESNPTEAARPRAVICVADPWRVIPELQDYSVMVVNPANSAERLRYLLAAADWSLLIDSRGEHYRSGGRFPNERVFWYTSGTTGDSKFCSFSQTQVDHMARRIIQSYAINSNDRYVSIMPLWHAHGQGFYWATQMAGCETHFLPANRSRDISNFAPTFVTAIPDLLRLVLTKDLADLRFVRSASSALPLDLFHALEDRFSVPVIEAFGMTEALSHCFTNPLEGQRKPGTVGRPDGIEAKVEDARLFIRGFTVCTDGWYDTGDLASVDGDGYYTIHGRSRDQINVRGIKINPASIEQQLLATFPDINQAVIFGTHRVRCVYVGDVDVDLVRSFLVSLGSYCTPDLIKKLHAIPIGPAGKISRSWLNDHFSRE